MIPVSDALKDLLDRKGMRSGTVGAVTKRGMKNAGVSYDSDGPQVPTEGREEKALLHGGGLRLAWSNPAAIAKGVTKRAPFPMIEGGR